MKVRINNKEYKFDEDITILEACNRINIKIPTLCYLKEINEIASCRICVVELVGKKNLVTACTTKIMDGMEILTDSKKVIDARKTTLELILSNHNKSCLSCDKSGHCELQRLCNIYQVDENRFQGEKTQTTIDDINPCIVRDNSKCILCNRCVATCEKIQGTEIIKRNNRGFDTEIGSNFNKKLCETSCVYCGQCVNVCPTGALMEHDDTQKVIEALNNPELHTVVAFAPSIRVAIGEEFGYDYGVNTIGKMVTSLRMMGFDRIFDVNYGADLTIVEEANELLERLETNKHLPLITSCCPGWVNYVTNNHPELFKNLSSCKSPQQMMGAIIKTYYAKLNKIDPKNIYVVSIMPCIAKKFERLNVQDATKYSDVDCVLTTRELAKLIKKYNIDFNNVEPSNPDLPLGKGNSGIFGASGGVMESALRYAKEVVENKKFKELDFKEVRGMKGYKEATVEIKGNKLNILVVNGLINTKPFIEDIKKNKCKYDFIEVMACPGGCINGGGQPFVSLYDRNNVNYKQKRAKGLYNIDKNLKSNKAKDNSYVKNLYQDFLGEPLSPKAHRILHRKYQDKSKKDN